MVGAYLLQNFYNNASQTSMCKRITKNLHTMVIHQVCGRGLGPKFLTKSQVMLMLLACSVHFAC